MVEGLLDFTEYYGLEQLSNGLLNVRHFKGLSTMQALNVNM